MSEQQLPLLPPLTPPNFHHHSEDISSLLQVVRPPAAPMHASALSEVLSHLMAKGRGGASLVLHRPSSYSWSETTAAAIAIPPEEEGGTAKCAAAWRRIHLDRLHLGAPPPKNLKSVGFNKQYLQLHLDRILRPKRTRHPFIPHIPSLH